MILLYSQIKNLKSLREIVTILESHSHKWRSIGIDIIIGTSENAALTQV